MSDRLFAKCVKNNLVILVRIGPNCINQIEVLLRIGYIYIHIFRIKL